MGTGLLFCNFFFFFLKDGVSVCCRLECSHMTLVHHNLELMGSSDLCGLILLRSWDYWYVPPCPASF